MISDKQLSTMYQIQTTNSLPLPFSNSALILYTGHKPTNIDVPFIRFSMAVY